MADVLKAVKRHEIVNVFERNRLIGHLVPADGNGTLKVEDHPFFGSAASDTRQVRDTLRAIRKNRMKKKFKDIK